MYIVIVKDNKPVDAYYKPGQSGYVELQYDSPMAKLYTMTGAKA